MATERSATRRTWLQKRTKRLRALLATPGMLRPHYKKASLFNKEALRLQLQAAAAQEAEASKAGPRR